MLKHTEAEGRRRTFILDTGQNHEKNISWLMFVSATSPLVLCMYKFVLNLVYLLLYVHVFLADQSGGLFNKVYLCFRLVCRNRTANSYV